MKTKITIKNAPYRLLKLCFVIWRRNHCGCRRIVDSRRHKIRRRVAFRAAMVVRAALILAGY